MSVTEDWAVSCIIAAKKSGRVRAEEASLGLATRRSLTLLLFQ